MALTAQTKVLPVAVVGAEEIFPWVYQAKGVARFLGLPALPLSPLYVPLPSPVDIIIGEPYEIPDLSPEAPDKDIDLHINNIRTQIRHMTNEGLKNRRPFFANKENSGGKYSFRFNHWYGRWTCQNHSGTSCKKIPKHKNNGSGLQTNHRVYSK